ncbi:RHS repeat-associated core domain-containing protein [Desmospora profundinema]|uniref:RHS repeat-associated core domain-containing protein n=1 Tax=Desmospora profundinema TaxID=1571184 RepID=UPI0035B51641
MEGSFFLRLQHPDGRGSAHRREWEHPRHYGYTAYGKDDEKAFTGVDKPDPGNPDEDVYNSYRYSAKRWDPATKQYDMGFRDYIPGLNRFLTRDMLGKINVRSPRRR